MSKSELYEVTVRESKEIMKACYKTDTPVILRGGPGIGKTSGCSQAAKELKVGCKIEEGSSLDITDVRGVQVPNLQEKTAFFTRPPIFPDAEVDGAEGFLLIDEAAGCMGSLQKALQSMFDLRRIGVHKLPEGWLPVATGNRATDDAGAFNLLSTFQDRMVCLNIKSSFQEWKEDFAFPNGVHHDIISYLNFSKKSFNTFSDRKRNSGNKGFASPRTYAMASRFLHLNLTEAVLFPVLVGLLGEGIAYELTAHRKLHKDLPDIDKIYAGKTDAVPKEPSALYVLSGALYGYLSNLPKGLKLSVAIERLLEYSRLLPREFAVLTMKDVMVTYRKDVERSRQFPSWAKEYRSLILPSGD
jgi:hypothetical protein